MLSPRARHADRVHEHLQPSQLEHCGISRRHGPDLRLPLSQREGGANTLHYGWARITLPTTGDGVLIDHAYNATPGAAIAAGDMGGPAAVVPEPSTYVLVGTGLATLGAVARRRARAV
jgi:hypothetical protein